MKYIGNTKKNFPRGVLPASCKGQLQISISCRFYVECIVCLFIYTLSTVSTCCYQLCDFPLYLSQPITGSLASPQVLRSLWKRLLCTKRLLTKRSTAVNQLAPDWSWSHLNIGPALWLEVVPLRKTRGILQYKILPGGSPCVMLKRASVQLLHGQMNLDLHT